MTGARTRMRARGSAVVRVRLNARDERREPDQRRVVVAAPRRTAPRRRSLRVRPAARRARPRVRAHHHARAPDGRRRRGARRGRQRLPRGRHDAARDPAGAPARGRVDARRLLRPPRDPRALVAAARVAHGGELPHLGVRVGGARPGAAPGGTAAPRGPRAGAAAAPLRQFARPRRGAVDGAAAQAARPLAGRALQARRRGDLGRGARRGGRGDRRGRHDRLQGPLRPRDQGSGGAGRALRPGDRRLPGRLPRGPARPPEVAESSATTSSASRTTRRSAAPATSARRRSRRASSTSSRRGSARCGRCSTSTRAARGRAGRCTAGAWASSASPAGRSSCSPRSSTRTPPTTWRPARTTRTTRPSMPASPLAPRPETTGFRWG